MGPPLAASLRGGRVSRSALAELRHGRDVIPPAQSQFVSFSVAGATLGRRRDADSPLRKFEK